MEGTGGPAGAVLLPDVPDAVLLVAVTDRLLATCPAELPGPVAVARTRALLVQSERLRAAALAAVRDLDNRELYALDGVGSTSGWLARERVGGRAAPVTTARRLASHPAVGAALAAGTLDVLGAERVCAALSRLPDTVDEPVVSAVLQDGVAALLQELEGAGGGSGGDPAAGEVLARAAAACQVPLPERVEPVLVLLAQRVAPAVLVRTLGLLVDALLPEEHLQRWEREQAQTYLDVRELFDGYADVRGVLDPETAVLLRGALARRALAVRRTSDGMGAGQRRVLALRQVLRDAAVQAGQPTEQPAADEHHPDDGDLEPGGLDQDDLDQDGGEQVEYGDDGHEHDGDQLTDDEVQPDGMQPRDDAPRAAPACAPPTADGTGVQLTLVTRLPAPLADPRPVPLLAGVDTVLGRPGALPGRHGPGLSTSLPVEAVRRLGCGSSLAAVLLDAHGRPVGASGSHRHATERERRALLAQWGGTCATDGCGRPAVVPHHVEPWWLTHRTRLKDLVPYCDGCHHDLHEGGKTIRLRNGRWIGPTGWTAPPAGSLDTA